jgi:predicted acylesterase/phospholipase RssA
MSIVEGLWKSSFLDNQPMYDLMDKVTEDKTFHRKVAFQSVDMNSGKVVIFDENTPDELKTKAIVSSGSLPIVFPPQYIENLVLVDGGVFTNLDLAATIVKCR